MAISRNIKPDRGLTYRMLMTGFLLVLLYGLVVGILIAVGISYALVLVIAVFGIETNQRSLEDLAPDGETVTSPVQETS